MEENKNIQPNEPQAPDEGGAVMQPAAGENASPESTPAVREMPVTMTATDAAEEESKDLSIALHWEFGEAPVAAPQTASAPTHATRRFVGVFAAVTAVFLAVLVVLLLIGDTGIKIYHTVTHERTVFVKDHDDGTSGLLAPEEAAEVVKQSTVTVVVRVSDGTSEGTAIGSGFIYTADGYICTNHHVVEDGAGI